ncbi:MAG: DUF962 domain-containing protein [Flavobacteriales bacterium]|nr:DUF962 domain-containing protein [Flavobacteriales bacterium]
MKTIHDWLAEYGESHQNKTNKTIHWICIPLIFWSIVALLYSVDLHFRLLEIPITAAHIALILTLLYYTRLSPSLSIGMMIFALICLTVCNGLQMVGFSLWKVALVVFVIAWIGQFIGHHIEGKKPSFLKDIQFLLIGPAWLMSDLFRKWGITL